MVIDELVGALDVLPEPMLLVSPDGSIAAANRALAAKVGLGRATLVGRRPVELLEDPPERVHEYLEACRRSGQMVLGSLTLRSSHGRPIACRADGAGWQPRGIERRCVLVRLVPRRESVGAFISLNEKIEALSAEIERRSRAEASLNRQRETLEVILAGIGDAVIATDPAGHILFMNRVAERLTGHPAKSACQRRLADLFRILDERTGEPIADPVQRVLATGTGLTHQAVLVRPDAARVSIDVSAAPIRLPDGTLLGVVLAFRDITAQRQAEDDRHEADRRKDEFLAILAHELRNPLAPIRNAIEIIRLAQGNPSTVEAARVVVERQLEHLARLIDDLMNISRITLGKIELRKEHTALSAVIQMAVEIARPHLENKRHLLQIELPGDSLDLEADASRLGQAFADLLENASKYSAAGTPIRIEARCVEDAIVVRIIDQGVGIPEHMRERIFDLFTQIHPDDAGPREGLGIGLTLVRRIVEMHGGSIVAESQGRARGSCFVVRFPRAKGLNGARAPEVTERTASATRKLRILIADDNRDAAHTLAMMLRLEGHEVRAAHDGAEALAIGDDFVPELVLLDIGMPVLDGYETARRIQGRSWGKRAHLVALTGWGQDADRRKAFAAGFHEHLVKPAAPEAIDAVIGKVASWPTNA